MVRQKKMGNDRIKKFLQKNKIECYKELEWGSFKTVAIDLSGLIIAFARVEYQRRVTNSTNLLRDGPEIEGLLSDVTNALITHLTTRYLDRSITPHVVFDGKPPEFKDGTLETREKAREGARKELVTQLELMKSMDPWEALKHLSKLSKIYKKQPYYPMGIKEILKRRFDELGIKWYQALGEAEELCAALAREGIVEAVYSKDQDLLAYRCSVMITDIYIPKYEKKESSKYNSGDGRMMCSVTLFEPILRGLNLDEGQFVDFYILLGTDYNTPMKTKTKAIIGQKLYHLIVEYRSIDNFPSTYDLTPLLHQQCRLQFAPKESGRLTVL